MFVSRFQPHTTIDSMKNYVKTQFSDCKSVTCSQLSTRYPSYTFFKIVMHGISLQDALNLDNWPEGILVKKFYSVSHTPTLKMQYKIMTMTMNNHKMKSTIFDLHIVSFNYDLLIDLIFL